MSFYSKERVVIDKLSYTDQTLFHTLAESAAFFIRSYEAEDWIFLASLQKQLLGKLSFLAVKAETPSDG